MHLVAIALIATLVGACTYWLYADIVTERAERRAHSSLLQVVEDYVTAVNGHDRKILESLTVGPMKADLPYDIISPIRVAAEAHGPAAVERFTVEAVGETTAIGYLVTSFADPRHSSERNHTTNISSEIVFKKDDGVWRISGTVL
ncbi:hypothetical protein [Arthrobacter sp. SLBN-53]|uniref:hypothetical protein n=1 Tax=Arthrobacter sp. SLBN-53 TaxID=2768412 RepID=UPI00114D4FCF|nr:hypothetical protein [Arthrobacter sp. SLBN-53]TQK30179.1 hypothetical protein FBY28_3195 [Arthrobacter sp. SLBN-53]